MAARRPKRMSRKELRQQDEVMTRLQSLYEWLRRYRVHLIVGALALVVVLLVASGLSSWVESSRREVATAFDTAFAAVIGDVSADEEAPAPPADMAGLKRDTFPSEAAKNEAATQRLQQFLEKNDDAALADDARLALGSVAYDEGQYDEAVKRLAAFVEDGDRPIAPVVLETLGLAALEQKNADEAAKWFGKLVEGESVYFQALGHLHLGDIANPGVPSAGAKDPGKARASYEAGLAAITAEDRPVSGSEEWLRGSLERRVALLDAR